MCVTVLSFLTEQTSQVLLSSQKPWTNLRNPFLLFTRRELQSSVSVHLHFPLQSGLGWVDWGCFSGHQGRLNVHKSLLCSLWEATVWQLANSVILLASKAVLEQWIRSYFFMELCLFIKNRDTCISLLPLNIHYLRKHLQLLLYFVLIPLPVSLLGCNFVSSRNVIRTEWKSGLGIRTGKKGARQQLVSCFAVSELSQISISLLSESRGGADLMLPSAQEAAGTGVQGKRIRHGHLRCKTFNCLCQAEKAGIWKDIKVLHTAPVLRKDKTSWCLIILSLCFQKFVTSTELNYK